MRKFICVLLSFVISLILVFIAVNVSIKDMIAGTISDVIVKDQVDDMVSDIIISSHPDIDDDEISKIEEYIDNSDEIKDIAGKYIDDIIGKGDGDVDINKDLEDLILSNKDELIQAGLDDEEINKVVGEIRDNEEIQEKYEEVKDNISNNMTDEQKMAIDTYNLLSSSDLRVGLIGIVLLLCVIISLILKSFFKMFMYVGVSSLVSGVVVRFGFVNLVNLVSWAITDDVIGRTSSINTDLLVRVGYWYMGVGVVFIIMNVIYKILMKKMSN